MRIRDLTALSRLAATASDAAEARMAPLRREEAELRGQIAALEEARRARATEAQVTDLALRAGVDLRWEGWIDRRSSTLSADLARLRARIEVAREELSRAIGRRTATEALATRARAEADARRLKIEERGW